MKRRLPLWVAAVVPATLGGHGLAYALAGRSVADGHHAWLAPTLECSLALLAALCLLLACGALLKAGIFTQTKIQQSCAALWPRLAVAQIALFAIVEHAEGAHVTLAGVLMQIAIALLAAYVLSLFTRLLSRCALGTQAASAYLQRLLDEVARYVSLPAAESPAFALAVRAGTSRFQRPPPNS